MVTNVIVDQKYSETPIRTLSQQDFCTFAPSKTTADEPMPTIPSYESLHGDFTLSRERPGLQICIP